ncbi:MAG: radical SAM protein [Nanoarchaeota archaeon]|nr:radical SAM protein [Nanoarchaeota archaeon]
MVKKNIKNESLSILLVEPDFPIPPKSKNHKNFLPIGLLKIGAYLKNTRRVTKVKLVRGNARAGFVPDEIWITSLFTYWSEYFWNSVKFYRSAYPNSVIRAGGIYASLHFNNKDFKENCKQYSVKPHFGIYDAADKCPPEYSLIPPNPHPLNYQIIHSTRGCPRHCKFCYTWKLEPKFTSKRTIKDEICSNKLVFYDNNLLTNKHIDEFLKEISGLKYNSKVVRCESQSGFDGRILEERPELAIALKKARFDNPRIAWDWNYSQWKRIEKQIHTLENARYPAKDIYVFMIFNWDIPFLEMERKRLKCWKWKVQITDCRYRPMTQLYDHFNSRSRQNSEDYFIHPKWSDAEVKQFRRNVRKQNICVRHGFPFHSGLLERKGVTKKLSMELRDLPREKVLQKVPDAWFPDKICKPPTKCF